MDFVLGMVLGAVLSFFYWRAVVIKAIEQSLLMPSKEIDQSTTAELEPNILNVMVEQEGDQFLLYKQGTNNFVMQGSCLQDFQQRLSVIKVDQLSIVNGGSAAAKALVEVSEKVKEKSENSNNQ